MDALRVAWLYFRVGAMNEMQYRVNFFVQLLQSLIALGTGLVGLYLIFSHVSKLGGWTAPELLAVMGVFTLMGGLISTVVQPNMERLMGEIQDGTFDYALTRPVDSQVIVSVREVHIWSSVDIITGLIVVAIAVLHLPHGVGVGEVAAFLAILLLGAAMIYCFWLLLTTVAFWVIRMDYVANLFDGIYAAGRYPVTIYPAWLRFGLTFLVPVAFAVTVPAEALTGRLSPATFLGAAALTAVLLVVTRWFWRVGLRHYSGASA